MASPSTVITLGYGSFGGVELIPTLGYGIGEAVIPPEPEVPESIDSLGEDLIMAKRRIGWRHGRMYPVKSVSPN